MDTDRLLDPVVKVALEAMNEGDRDLWLSLFDVHAILTDDGNQRDYKQWSATEIFGAGKGRITSISSVVDRGLTIHANFHSARWGDFKTFWRFKIEDGKIVRLDVGQEEG
jgi:hypothetical protein